MIGKFCIILFLIFTVSVFAQTTTVWNPAANQSATGSWSEAASWTNGVPSDTTKAVFNVPDAMDCTLDAVESIGRLVTGDNGPGGMLTLENGADLTISSMDWSSIGWTDTATFVVEEGATVTFGHHLWIGFNAGANGIIHLNGGTINVNQMFGVAWGAADDGAGTVSVNSGVLNLAQLHPTQSLNRAPAVNALLDITGGSVVINGDKLMDVNNYIAAGNITAYGGDGEVVVTVAEGKTTLTALPGEALSFEDFPTFDGIDDFIDAGNGDALNISGAELTLEAWIKANGWKTNVWEGCVINTESAPNNGYMIRVGANGTVNFNVGNQGWNEINTAEAALQLDTWHHLAATFNAGVMTIYIDGVLAVTADNSATVDSVGVATTPTVIGNWGNLANPGRSFDGAIADARVWNVARSAEDIAAYKDVLLTGSEEGLAGYWPLNEGAGAQVVADLTGNSTGGQLGSTPEADDNDPRWEGEVIVPPFEARPMDFLVFDGTSQYVDAGNASSLKLTGSELTLEALINMTEWRDNVWQGCIVNKEGAAKVGYMLRAGKNGTLNFNIGGSNDAWNELNTPEGTLSLNSWHHVAGTFDDTTMTLYVDGIKIVDSTFATAFTIRDTDENLFIGSSAYNPDRTADGGISQVRVWNVTRTHQEIADHMNGDLMGTEAGLVAYWKLDEGEGQTVADLTSNANTGQLGSTADVDANDPAWGPVTVARPAGPFMPEFPPTYFQGPFPFGSEDVRFDAPCDEFAPSGDGVFHEYTAYRGTPNYDGDDGNLDEDEWNKIPWTLLQFNQEQGYSVYNVESGLGWTGFTDHAAWFKMLHDDDNVYLAVMKVDDMHTWSDQAWDDTFYLWQCDAIQLQFDGRAPGIFDDPMPQAEIGLGSIDDEDAYHYWEGGPGEPVINQQLELAPGSSESSFASVYGKALHTSVGPHPTEEGLVLETIEAAFVKWDDIMSDDDFAMMMSIITLDRDTVGVGRPASEYFTVFEWGQGLFQKNRRDYASLVLSASDVPVGIEDQGKLLPSEYVLKQNYPNPFNPSTTIAYSIPKQAKVDLTVYNVLGQKVMNLVDQKQVAGSYEVTFEASKFSSGIYFFTLKSGDFRKTKKMMLLK